MKISNPTRSPGGQRPLSNPAVFGLLLLPLILTGLTSPPAPAQTHPTPPLPHSPTPPLPHANIPILYPASLEPASLEPASLEPPSLNTPVFYPSIPNPPTLQPPPSSSSIPDASVPNSRPNTPRANSSVAPEQAPHAAIFSPPPGLCFQGQQDISGSWVNDGTGQLVPLVVFCQAAIQHQQTTLSSTVEPDETEFWQAFVTAASPEALAFANAADRDDVEAYGQTICPSLHELGTMGELRGVQAQGGLLASFDAAVNVAAIHTYCPEKSRSIGR